LEDLSKILTQIPQRYPFKFVDEFIEVGEEKIIGKYTYRSDEFFYRGHFPQRPVTPGVILIETMAQIGLMGFGIWLRRYEEINSERMFFLVSVEAQFLAPVYPGETVIVEAEKIYFRMGKLKIRARMTDSDGNVKVVGELSGIESQS
jgi:3-hydroxyacyl-[acyl-carrier-protein] dehydratase